MNDNIITAIGWFENSIFDALGAQQPFDGTKKAAVGETAA
jgi:hypothetical protein